MKRLINICVYIQLQPYRTTPLILPGAKVKKEFAPNDCYLRHHPNPAMRGRAPHVDDFLMRQKVADSVLNRVVGDTSGKVMIPKIQNLSSPWIMTMTFNL